MIPGTFTCLLGWLCLYDIMSNGQRDDYEHELRSLFTCILTPKIPREMKGFCNSKFIPSQPSKLQCHLVKKLRLKIHHDACLPHFSHPFPLPSQPLLHPPTLV